MVTEFSNGITAASSPAGITIGLDNNVWFGENSADKVGRLELDVAATPTGSGSGSNPTAVPGTPNTGWAPQSHKVVQLVGISLVILSIVVFGAAHRIRVSGRR